MADKKIEGKLKGVEIFRAGKYPQGEFTESDIGKIAKSYDPDFSRARAWIAHPAKEGERLVKRAVGWIEKVYAEGKTLIADFTDVPEKFIELLKANTFNERSAEIYMDLEGRGLYLKGLAWLPANENPQVKGLAFVGEDQIFEEKDDPDSFVACNFSDDVSLKAAISEYEEGQKLRNILDTFNRMTWDVLNSADNYSSKVENLKKLITELSELDTFKETIMSEKETQTVTTKVENQAATEGQTKQFSEADVTKIVNTAVASAEERIRAEFTAESRKQAIVTEVKNFCEQMVLAGKMTPAERETEEPMLIDQSIKDSTATFAEGQVATSKKRMDLYRNRTPIVSFNEVDKNKGTNPGDRVAKAKEVAAQAVATFSETPSLANACQIGIFKVQSLRDAGFSEAEIVGLPVEVVTKDEIKQAGL